MSLSASKLPLAAKCSWWCRPDVALPVQSETSEAAALGTALHAYADGGDLATLSLDVDPDELAELAANYRAWWSEYSSGRTWELEVPFAFDAYTGRSRRMSSGGQGQYPERWPDEIPGTADAIAPDECLDLKTGRPPKTAAAYREQLEHAAVCLSQTTGATEVRATIAHVTADGVEVDSIELDAFDLAAASERMRALWAAIPTAEPRSGPWCRSHFCPAIAICPETQAPLALVPEVRRLPLLGEVENDADAWALIDGLPRFKAWIKDREAALKRAALARGRIVGADGREYSIVTVARETLRLDAPGAEDAIRSVLGVHTPSAIETVRKTSKSAIKAAAKAAGMPQADTEKRVVKAMRDVGAVKVSEHDEPRIQQQPAMLATGTEQGR